MAGKDIGPEKDTYSDLRLGWVVMRGERGERGERGRGVGVVVFI